MADWGYRTFYAAVLIACVAALLGPDAFKATQSAVEQVLMLALLPMFLFTAFALSKTEETSHEAGTVDH